MPGAATFVAPLASPLLVNSVPVTPLVFKTNVDVTLFTGIDSFIVTLAEAP